MNRENKFRGYDTDSKVWRYGAYFCKEDVTLYAMYNSKEEWERAKQKNEHHLILMNGFSDWGLPRPHYQSEVDGKSVGQYTGVLDKNRTPIYEGDILRGHGNDNDLAKVVFGDFDVIDVETLDVIESIIGWHYEVIPTDALSNCEPFNISMPLNRFYIDRCEFEVIGNVYENPELLGGGNNE